MLLGEGATGMTLALDAQSVRVSADGRFVLGFGRDHGPRSTLRINNTSRNIQVARREWEVQHISGQAGFTPDAVIGRRTTAERERLASVRRRDTSRTDFTHPFAWPTRGEIIGVFGTQRVVNGRPRQPNYGMELAGELGSPILAALPGQVALATDLFDFGRMIVLDHGHGLHTVYGNLSEHRVAEGAEVAQGEHIADMGATGRVASPQLLFSLGWKLAWLDPQPLLP